VPLRRRKLQRAEEIAEGFCAVVDGGAADFGEVEAGVEGQKNQERFLASLGMTACDWLFECVLEVLYGRCGFVEERIALSLALRAFHVL
jgi:hypothetical protein